MKIVDENALPPRLLEGGAAEQDDLATADLLNNGQGVAAPDDLSLERVWREVGRNRRKTRRRQRRYWQAALATGLVATAAYVTALLLRSGDMPPIPSAHLDLTAGDVLAAEPNRSWTQARAGNQIPNGSQLRTQNQGRGTAHLCPFNGLGVARI